MLPLEKIFKDFIFSAYNRSSLDQLINAWKTNSVKQWHNFWLHLAIIFNVFLLFFEIIRAVLSPMVSLLMNRWNLAFFWTFKVGIVQLRKKAWLAKHAPFPLVFPWWTNFFLMHLLPNFRSTSSLTVEHHHMFIISSW